MATFISPEQAAEVLRVAPFAHLCFILPVSVLSLALMLRRSEWPSARRNANSCNSLSRMLMRPSLLLFLALLAQVFRTQCRPAGDDEGKLLPLASEGGVVNIT